MACDRWEVPAVAEVEPCAEARAVGVSDDTTLARCWYTRLLCVCVCVGERERERVPMLRLLGDGMHVCCACVCVCVCLCV